jgi:hypothetical protein
LLRQIGMEENVSRRSFAKGDWVVFRKRKSTTHPGPRAQDIRAAAHGDTYYYSVEKFWIVADVLADGKLLLQTRRGKQHVIDANDPQLRRATLWDRIRYRAHFLQIQVPLTSVESPLNPTERPSA